MEKQRRKTSAARRGEEGDNCSKSLGVMVIIYM